MAVYNLKIVPPIQGKVNGKPHGGLLECNSLNIIHKNLIIIVSHRFMNEYGCIPVSEVSGLTLYYPVNTLRPV